MQLFAYMWEFNVRSIQFSFMYKEGIEQKCTNKKENEERETRDREWARKAHGRNEKRHTRIPHNMRKHMVTIKLCETCKLVKQCSTAKDADSI